MYIILSLSLFFSRFRYMGIGLSAQGVNMNRLPGKNRQLGYLIRLNETVVGVCLKQFSTVCQDKNVKCQMCVYVKKG